MGYGVYGLRQIRDGNHCRCAKLDARSTVYRKVTSRALLYKQFAMHEETDAPQFLVSST